MLKRFLSKKSSLQTSLFKVDALGAILSAFFLGFVLVQLEQLFGIPARTLYILSGLAVMLSIYDLLCLTYLDDTNSVLLRNIAFANYFYCVITLVFIAFDFQTITALGWLYICIELAIVFSLATIELIVSKKKTP